MKNPTQKSKTYTRSAATRRLSPADVVSIRETYCQSTATTCASLARRYKVAPSMIHGIVGHWRACVARLHRDNLEIVGGRPINGGAR